MNSDIKPDFEIREISKIDIRFLQQLESIEALNKAYKAGQKDMLSRIEGTNIFEQSILETTVKRLQEENEQYKEALKQISEENYDDDDKKHHLYATIDRMKSCADKALKSSELNKEEHGE